MKFAVVTYGTEGDTRPLAALCRALMDAGHETRLLADGATLSMAHTLGVPAQNLAGDIKGAFRPGNALSDAMDKGHRVKNMAQALASVANSHTESWMRDLTEAASGCDAILLSALASFVGLSVAEYLGIPGIGAGFIPITPTRAFPSPFLPPRWIPRALNRPSYRLVNNLIWHAFRKATNAARATVCGLPPRRKVWTDHPILYGVSPTLLSRPDDWPKNTHMCGQWIPSVPQWLPPTALCDFLSAGEPPLYISFGSMAGFDHHKLLHAVMRAVGGRRALFQPGWSGADSTSLPTNIFRISDTPHDWLFPKVSFAIHHGGAGTSHSATRAGVPSVVVPFAGDQYFWAERLRQLGVAAAPIPAKHFDAAALRRAIKFAESPATRVRAAGLRAQMAGEDGLCSAVSAIEMEMAYFARSDLGRALKHVTT
jgi:sterol 3beta-glucosyltransferase